MPKNKYRPMRKLHRVQCFFCIRNILLCEHYYVPHIFISAVSGYNITELKDLLWTEINKEENRVNTFTHRNLDVQRPTADDEENDWDEEIEDFDDEDEEWDEDWNDDNDNAGGYMVDDIEYV